MVQVPKIERFQTQSAMPKNDRINMQVKDQAGLILQRGNDLVDVADGVDKLFLQAENNKIEELSNSMEGEFNAWNAEQLGRLKAFKGDPTDAYVEYDKQSKAKREEILSKRENLNERTRAHVTGRLDKVASKHNEASLNQRGAQQETYSRNLYETTVNSRRNDLSVRAGYVKAGDKDSHASFKEGMNDVTTTIAKRGIKEGTVVELPADAKSWSHQYLDDDGRVVKVSMNPMAKERVAKELSEGVRSSIDVLISSGQTEAARDMQEEYGKYLDPKSTTALNNKFKTAGRKDEAYSVIQTIRTKSEDAQLEAIEKIPDPELRSDVIKYKEADDRKMQAMRDRKSKANYERLSDVVYQKMNSDQPFYGIAELEDSDTYKATWDNMTAKQKKDITEMVEAPKDSSPKAKDRMTAIMTGEIDVGIENMSISQFNGELSGLSKADRSKAEAWYKKQKNPSSAQERMSVKQTTDLTKNILLRQGHLIENEYGKFVGDDKERYLAVKEKIINYFADRQTIPSEKEVVDIANKFAASEIDDKVFNPYGVKKKTPAANNQGASQTAPKNNTISPKDNPVVGMKPIDIVNKKAEFQRINGFIPSSKDPRFIQFVQKG